MSTPSVQPVPPVPPAPLPLVVAEPVPRRAQIAAVLLILFVTGLVGWRWCADRFGTRPTQLQRDSTHRIDLNRATRSELMQIPSVGPSLADRIVAERGARGKFNRVDDLAGVHGIGDATLNKIRPWVVVEASETAEPSPPEPDRLVRKPTGPTHTVKKPNVPDHLIDINSATVAELDTLPGIGPVLANRIIAEREKKPFAKIEDLRRVSGIGPKKLEVLRALVTVGE